MELPRWDCRHFKRPWREAEPEFAILCKFSKMLKPVQPLRLCQLIKRVEFKADIKKDIESLVHSIAALIQGYGALLAILETMQAREIDKLVMIHFII